MLHDQALSYINHPNLMLIIVQLNFLFSELEARKCVRTGAFGSQILQRKAFFKIININGLQEDIAIIYLHKQLKTSGAAFFPAILRDEVYINIHCQ